MGGRNPQKGPLDTHVFGSRGVTVAKGVAVQALRPGVVCVCERKPCATPAVERSTCDARLPSYSAGQLNRCGRSRTAAQALKLPKPARYCRYGRRLTVTSPPELHPAIKPQDSQPVGMDSRDELVVHIPVDGAFLQTGVLCKYRFVVHRDEGSVLGLAQHVEPQDVGFTGCLPEETHPAKSGSRRESGDRYACGHHDLHAGARFLSWIDDRIGAAGTVRVIGGARDASGVDGYAVRQSGCVCRPP